MDIHSQHQSYNYMQQKNYITLLDNGAPAEHKSNLILFKDKYMRYKSLQNRLEELINNSQNTERQRDFLKFQASEIESVGITDINEDEELKKELDILSNAEKIKELAYSAYWGLNGDDLSVIDMLGKIKSNISKLTSFDASLSLSNVFVLLFLVL